MKENNSIINEENPTTIWEKEYTLRKEDCKLVLISENKEDKWYIDSGCLAHMIGDQYKFTSLKKEKRGSVAFGNDSTIKIFGKGVVNLGNQKIKEEGDFLIEYLKHNILSV